MWTDFKLPDEFTWSEKGRIRELSRYLIGGQFQELVYRSRKGRKVVDMGAFERIVDLSHDRAMKFLRKLKKYKVLREIVFLEQTYFVMNPKYGLHKRRLHPIAYRVFMDEVKDLLPPYIVCNYERVIENEKYMSIVKIKR